MLMKQLFDADTSTYTYLLYHKDSEEAALEQRKDDYSFIGTAPLSRR